MRQVNQFLQFSLVQGITPYIVLTLAILCAYSGVISLEFAFDDRTRFLENPGIRDSSFLAAFFLEPSWPGNLYRPLESVLLLASYQVFGLSPLPQHLINAGIHWVVCVLLYLLLKRKDNSAFALWASLLFSVHPIHVEAVANISYRSELLVALFVLCCAYCILQFCATYVWTWLIALSVCFLLGSLSKESIFIVWPISALLLYYKKCIRIPRYVLPVAVALLLPSGLYLFLRFNALGSISGVRATALVNPLIQLSPELRIANAWTLLGQYSTLIAFPYPLRPSYSFAQIVPHKTLLSAILSPHAAVAFGLMLIAISGIKIHSRASFWAAAFFAAFSVTANILIPIGTVFAERLAYVPSIALCALVALIHTKLGGRILLSLLVILSIWRSVIEVPHWQNDKTLFDKAVQVSPMDSLVLSNHGYQLFLQKEYVASIEHHLRAVKIYPYNKPSLRGLAYAYYELGQYNRAIHWLGKLFPLEPYDSTLYTMLGKIFLLQFKQTGSKELLTQSRTVLNKALSLNSENEEAQSLLKEVVSIGQIEE